ncbi:hypothetical protein REPUB_Repub04eG0082700 [Reevesia pubescens]
MAYSSDSVSIDMETISLGGKEYLVKTCHGTVSVAVFEDKEVQRDMKLVPYKIVNKDGKPYIQVKIKDGETKVFSPEEISAMILIKMKETAEAFRVPWSHLIMLVTWQALSCHCMLGRRQIFDLYIVLVNVVKGLKLYEDVFTNSELAKLSDF